MPIVEKNRYLTLNSLPPADARDPLALAKAISAPQIGEAGFQSLPEVWKVIMESARSNCEVVRARIAAQNRVPRF